MTLPTDIWFCEEHRSPAGDRHIDGVSRCFLALDEGLIIRDCRFIELRVAGPDDLVIRRDAIDYEAAARYFCEMVHPEYENKPCDGHLEWVNDLVGLALAAAEGGEE